MNTHAPDWMGKVKWLTQALLISGALNICLLATFVYFAIQEKKSSLDFELSSAAQKLPPTNQEVLRAYSTVSFHDLVLKLDETELREDGYSKRDLALSALVAFHHLDIERALGGNAFQKRKITFSSADGQETIDLLMFPGLKDEQYRAIKQFITVEKWPLTSQGLFFEIQRSKKQVDPTLLNAFLLTREFESVCLLFARSGVHISKETILNLLLEGDWAIIERLMSGQKLVQDLTPQRRLAFLIEYLHKRSITAAKLLVETDLDFALRRLDDPHVLLLLELLTEKSHAAEKFAKVLLISPRCDLIQRKAAAKLYAFAGEPAAEPYDHALALSRFVPQVLAKRQASAPQKPVVKPPQALPVATKKKQVHVIKDGESLWKIAKKYRVSIESIMKANHLETEKLRPGKELVIPEK